MMMMIIIIMIMMTHDAIRDSDSGVLSDESDRTVLPGLVTPRWVSSPSLSRQI